MNIELLKTVGMHAAKLAGSIVIGGVVGLGIVAVGDRVVRAGWPRRHDVSAAPAVKPKKRNVRKTKSPSLAAVLRADKEIADEDATKQAFAELQNEINAELALKDAPERKPNKRTAAKDPVAA